MRVLALDTSTEYCSVALWHDGAVIDRCELAGQEHSELLIDMLDALLKDAGIRLAQVDGIAYGKGPGSFTGVRIACGVAQGLAFGANLSVAGVCTLEALAEASGRTRVIAALDARMGEIYHAAYEKQDGVWATVSEPCLCKPEDAPKIGSLLSAKENTELTPPPALGENWFGVGSGFVTHGNALNERYAGQLLGVDASMVPQAAAIAALGAVQFIAGNGADATQALPLYLRDKVALKTSERVKR
jgi:tRNA threonylcarbamoyladenosine biosynthesis protein TsaB